MWLYVRVASRGTPRSAREGRDLVTFAAAACCTGLALRPHSYLEKTDEAAACGFTVDLHLRAFLLNNSTHVIEYCAVIGHTLYRA